MDKSNQSIVETAQPGFESESRRRHKKVAHCVCRHVHLHLKVILWMNSHQNTQNLVVVTRHNGAGYANQTNLAFR